MQTPLQALRALLRHFKCVKCGAPAITGEMGDLRCEDHIGCGVVDCAMSADMRNAQQVVKDTRDEF